MVDSFIGEIRPFAFNFVPYGWLPCDGSTRPIQSFSALFAMLGTRFGGDGRTTFGLPDLRGRAVTSYVSNASATNTPPEAALATTAGNLAATWGSASVPLNVSQIPIHTHVAKGYGSTTGVSQLGTADNTSYLGLVRQSATYDIWSTNAPTGTLNQAAIGISGGTIPTGAAQDHPNAQPYLPVNFCICWDGTYRPNPG